VKKTRGKIISFNLSHSHGLALYAITRGRRVGFDVELVRPNLENTKIAQRFFSPREVAAINALPTHVHQEAFFKCWTRKEAYIKARGEGLSINLDKIELIIDPAETAVILKSNGNQEEASLWSLKEVLPGPGYIAALATEGHDWPPAYWQWQA